MSKSERPDWTAPFSAQWSIVSDKAFSDLPPGFVPDPQPSDSKPIIHIEGVGKVRMFLGFEKLPANQQQNWADRIVASNWRTKFVVPLAEALALTLAVSLAVYGVVRAIGWVIGGFMAS